MCPGRATFTTVLLFYLCVTLKPIRFSNSCFAAEDVAGDLFLSGPGVLTCCKSCGAGGTLPGPTGHLLSQQPHRAVTGAQPVPKAGPGVLLSPLQ